MDNEIIKKKRIGRKVYFFLFFILLLISLGLYGYLWQKNNLELKKEAQVQIEKAQEYIFLNKEITDEFNRCQSFVVQGQGDFANFEYCKRFINWVNDRKIIE